MNAMPTDPYLLSEPIYIQFYVGKLAQLALIINMFAGNE